jgi:hypothetical protein
VDLIYKVCSIYLHKDENIIDSFFTKDNYFDNKFCILDKLDYTIDLISSDLEEIKSKVERYNLTMIKMENCFTLSQVNGNEYQSYQKFDVIFNETKCGINIQKFEIGLIWEKGQNTYSTYKLFDYFGSREISIRDIKINAIIG